MTTCSAPMENLSTPEAYEYITQLRQEEFDKLRRRRTDAAALEMREREGREADAVRERKKAASRAREDQETLRQMRQARSDFDGGASHGEDEYNRHDGPERPGAELRDPHVVDLGESEDEENGPYEVIMEVILFVIMSSCLAVVRMSTRSRLFLSKSIFPFSSSFISQPALL